MDAVSAMCKQGIHAYLAEQHQQFRNKTLLKSIGVGALASGILAFVNQQANLSISVPYLFLPFGLITIAGMGEGILLSNNSDLEHKEAFDFVCKDKEGEDDEGN